MSTHTSSARTRAAPYPGAKRLIKASAAEPPPPDSAPLEAVILGGQPAPVAAKVTLGARFVLFLVGSAVLLALASLWILMHFSPNGFRLGLAAPRVSRLAAPPPPAAQPTPVPVPVSTPRVPAHFDPPKTGSPTATASPTATPTPSAVVVVHRSGPPDSAARLTELPVSTPATTAPAPATSNAPPPESSTPTSAPPTPPPAVVVQQDTSPVNAPGALVHVESILFSGDAPWTVTITGLQPTDGSIISGQLSIDWGDGTPAGRPSADAGATLSHSYPTAGTYPITYGYTTDVTHQWTHSVTLADPPQPAPAPQLTNSGNDDAAQFSYADPNWVAPDAWSAWTLDYGDGYFTNGAGDVPDSAASQYDYRGLPHAPAQLTVIGPDGQLVTTAAVPTGP